MRRASGTSAFSEITVDDIIGRIREVDGQLILLDSDVADFYGVTRTELRAMVRRNRAILPVEFVIPMDTNRGRKRALAFTEHGVIVAASMLDDSGLEAVSIHLVRAFVRLREARARERDFARRIEVLDEAVAALDAKIRRHFVEIYEAMGMSVAMTRGSPPKIH